MFSDGLETQLIQFLQRQQQKRMNFERKQNEALFIWSWFSSTHSTMEPFSPGLTNIHVIASSLAESCAVAQWHQQVLAGFTNKQNERNMGNAACGKRSCKRSNGNRMKMKLILSETVENCVDVINRRKKLLKGTQEKEKAAHKKTVSQQRVD